MIDRNRRFHVVCAPASGVGAYRECNITLPETATCIAWELSAYLPERITPKRFETMMDAMQLHARVVLADMLPGDVLVIGDTTVTRVI